MTLGRKERVMWLGLGFQKIPNKEGLGFYKLLAAHLQPTVADWRSPSPHFRVFVVLIFLTRVWYLLPLSLYLVEFELNWIWAGVISTCWWIATVVDDIDQWFSHFVSCHWWKYQIMCFLTNKCSFWEQLLHLRSVSSFDFLIKGHCWGLSWKIWWELGLIDCTQLVLA